MTREEKGFKESIASKSWRLEYIVYFITWRALYVRCTVIIFSSGSFGDVMPRRGFAAHYLCFPLCNHFNVLVGDYFFVVVLISMSIHAYY